MKQIEKQLIKKDTGTREVVTPERRAFLDAAFQEHLRAEIAGDLQAIVASYSKGGHLNFNGVLYDTPERLTAFHRDFGFDGRGMLSGIDGALVHGSELRTVPRPPSGAHATG